MTTILPAIMPTSFQDLREKIEKVVRYVDMVQIDVMDGRFVKSRSWPYYSSDKDSFEALLNEEDGMPRWQELDFEVDLMIEKPEEVIQDWITAGATRIVIHCESTQHMRAIIDTHNQIFAFPPDGVAREVELGIALNIDTPTDTILEYLEDIDFVQFMGIQTIGLQGEPFDERVLDKIREFHNAHPEIEISVDGGVSLENAHALLEAGAQALVVGSGIYGRNDIPQAIHEFKKIS